MIKKCIRVQAQELAITNRFSLNVSFDCDPCEKVYKKCADLKVTGKEN